MRVAVLSDIHGNLPALEAVVSDLKDQSPDDIWCGGDIGWGAPWASECIARVRDAGWKTVKGNTDVWISGDPQTVGTEEDRRDLMELAEVHAISEDDAQWLLNLPIGHTGPGSILLVHGTPDSPFTAPMPDDPGSKFRVYEEKAALVVYGHVHRAFVRRLPEGTLVCNTGSVGLPMDGETASYLLIDQSGPDLLLRHRRVAYDRDKAVEEARRLENPVATRFIESVQSQRA
jgi:putative phosphoesterase